MKILRLTFLAFLLAPVCAFAQGTKVIPLGGGFGLDTKVPVSFDAAAFNLKFTQQMNAVRAMQAANQAGVKNLPAAPGETTPAAENEQDYTRCIVCREKILKTDGYQITPKRDWYVKKHSSCACDFYKGWEKSEDLSFVQTAEKRHSCEAEMNKKYETHTCAVCGKPINSACGSISIWEDDRGKHYAHASSDELYPQLVPVAVKSAFHSTGASDVARGKHACKHRPYDSAHAMHAKGVESVVVFEVRLYRCHHHKAHHGGDNAYGEGAKQVYRSCGGGDGDQSCHCSCASTYRRGLAVEGPVEGHPRHGGGGGGDVCHHECVGVETVGSQSAASIESKPSEPKE